MSSHELRKKFLAFFEERGHTIVSSSSLIPDDSSVLFTTAGMQQFKPYYIGKADALKDFGGLNAASVQKCFRTSDVGEVGDKSHLTFLEMLGNFSFGGYFKKEAIHWAYEFMVNELGINPERISVTTFVGDQEIPEDKESFSIWHKEIGLAENRIEKRSRKDNFWGPTGNEGPCGPTTEIYIDGVEVWNLVFNEYYCASDGKLTKLETPGVDTGMGLERLAMVLQGVDSVFETDLFRPLITKIQEVAPHISVNPRLDPRKSASIVRILADHLRASVFLAADGVRPSNKEGGYVLRRLLRRILAYQIKYDIHADLFSLAAEIIKSQYGGFYPEVARNAKEILSVLLEEKSKFEKALALGIKEIEKYAQISAEGAFYLYETFGLPFELLRELAPDKMKGVKEEDFGAEFEKHQEISRAGAEKKFGGHGLVLDTGELKAGTPEEADKVVRLHTATHLLQQALRDMFGQEVHQTGSDINPERLRFDFSFHRKLTEEELKEAEEIVNEKIQKDLPVYFKEMPLEEARRTGALAFFREKYPDKVKVYFIGNPSASSGRAYSAEFCGGPHVTNTLKIGEFKILKQEAVGAGVRRIRAAID